MPPDTSIPTPRKNVLPWLVLVGIVVLCCGGIFYAYRAGYFGPDYFKSSEENLGSIPVRLDTDEGFKAVGILSLTDFSFVPDTTMATSVPAVAQINLSDGSVVTLSEFGIIRMGAGTPRTITTLVESPIPVPLRTAFAISNDGTRLAWVNPGDRSLQVFEKNINGTYLPLFLQKLTPVNSMVFTADNTHIIAAHIIETGTDILLVDIEQKKVSLLKHLPEFVTIRTP